MNKTTLALVSVCMVTYNHETFIAQAIDGVLMQKGDFKIRLIISDDGSMDKTSTICRDYAQQYPETIMYLQNKINLGAKQNFQRVMSQVKGNYLAFCEGDDYWTDLQKLQKQITFLNSNKDYNMCFNKTLILKRDGTLTEDFITRIPADNTTLNDLIRSGNYIHTSSVVLRNNFVIPSWYWTCPIGDYPLYFLAVKDGKIKFFHEAMTVYRFGGNYSKLPVSIKKLSFLLSIGELIKNYPDKKIKIALLNRQNIAFIYILIFVFFGSWTFKDLKTAIGLLWIHQKRNQPKGRLS